MDNDERLLRERELAAEGRRNRQTLGVAIVTLLITVGVQYATLMQTKDISEKGFTVQVGTTTRSLQAEQIRQIQQVQAANYAALSVAVTHFNASVLLAQRYANGHNSAHALALWNRMVTRYDTVLDKAALIDLIGTKTTRERAAEMIDSVTAVRLDLKNIRFDPGADDETERQLQEQLQADILTIEPSRIAYADAAREDLTG